jgi:hypothetical protein
MIGKKEWRRIAYMSTNKNERLSPYGAEHTSSKTDIWDELNVTMGELNKAVENVSFMVHTVHDLGLFSKLGKAKRNGISFPEIIKKIDLQQVSAILQSPLVRDVLTDPEFFQLLMQTNIEQNEPENLDRVEEPTNQAEQPYNENQL